MVGGSEFCGADREEGVMLKVICLLQRSTLNFERSVSPHAAEKVPALAAVE